MSLRNKKEKNFSNKFYVLARAYYKYLQNFDKRASLGYLTRKNARKVSCNVVTQSNSPIWDYTRRSWEWDSAGIQNALASSSLDPFNVGSTYIEQIRNDTRDFILDPTLQQDLLEQGMYILLEDVKHAYNIFGSLYFLGSIPSSLAFTDVIRMLNSMLQDLLGHVSNYEQLQRNSSVYIELDACLSFMFKSSPNVYTYVINSLPLVFPMNVSSAESLARNIKSHFAVINEGISNLLKIFLSIIAEKNSQPVLSTVSPHLVNSMNDSRLQVDLNKAPSEVSMQQILKSIAAGGSLDAVSLGVLKSMSLDQLSMLTEIPGFSMDSFSLEAGTVMKIIFNLKNLVLFKGDSVFYDGLGNFSSSTNTQKTVSYKIEIFYIISKNDCSITRKHLLQTIYQMFWVEAISFLIPTNILLESIQGQQIFPTKNKSNLFQENFGSTGAFKESTEMNHKPFIIGLTPILLSGSKNAFKISVPCVGKKFADPIFFSTEKEKLKKIEKVLQEKVVIGSSGNLVLSLAVHTSRAEAVSPYMPVQSVSISGFFSNGKGQNAAAATLFKQGSNIIPSSTVDADVIIIENNQGSQSTP